MMDCMYNVHELTQLQWTIEKCNIHVLSTCTCACIYMYMYICAVISRRNIHNDTECHSEDGNNITRHR